MRRLLTFAALCLMATTAHAATTWDAYMSNPVASVPAAKAVIQLAEEIKQKTNGELVINVHLGGSLPIKVEGITPAVSDNVIQFAEDTFSTGTVPMTGVLRLPMLLQSSADRAKAMDIALPYLNEAYGKRGIIVLGQYTYPFQVIWGKRKIASLDDIKGLKLRVTSVEQGELIRRFGGVPLTMGAPDVAAALDRGVVEGVLTASSGGGIVWHELVKYRYAFPTSYVNSTFIVNKEAFEALSPAIQKILRDSTAEHAKAVIGEMDRVEDELTAQFAKEGLTLTSATPEDVKRATETVRSYWDEWAKRKGPEEVEVLAKIRAAVGR
jgi:TRAP-type C4-dicarboxylate transport system substrate-binding protein